MFAISKNAFKLLISEIFNLPVWIKQIIYLELKEDFESSEMKTYFKSISKDNCFQLYTPKLTYAGRKEIRKKEGKFKQEIYDIMEGAFQNLSIIEIAISNDWSFYECAKYFLEAVENDLFINPTSPVLRGTALYMAGKIRLGEYFVKINKINMDQLDEALRNQKYLEDALGEKPGLADIMIDLGFLKKEDTEGILILKQDSKNCYKSIIAEKKDLEPEAASGN